MPRRRDVAENQRSFLNDSLFVGVRPGGFLAPVARAFVEIGLHESADFLILLQGGALLVVRNKNGNRKA